MDHPWHYSPNEREAVAYLLARGRQLERERAPLLHAVRYGCNWHGRILSNSCVECSAIRAHIA